jgi:putative ATP-binding cassette transporter
MLLEDRDLLLFDEWAADQDPEFRNIFYRELLPSLRKRNKAIVVISHDDRYFDVADQVVTLSDGKIIGVHQRGEYGVASGAQHASVAVKLL